MDSMKYWLPVDVYIGGDEHNTLHLLYSRFIYQFLYDLGVVPTPEPYQKRVSHGVILGHDNHRMSKTRGNVVIPDDIADKVGVDATRAYLMFIGPFDGTMAWNDNALMGVKRFNDRLHKLYNDRYSKASDSSSREVDIALNRMIKLVGEAIETFQYNTVVPKYMEFLNLLEKTSDGDISKDVFSSFAKVISPIMPYMSEELWSIMGYSFSVHEEKWPEYDESVLVEGSFSIPVQINGKVRGKITVSSEANDQEVKDIIEKEEALMKHTEGLKIQKVIYVKGKIVNIVAK